MKKTTVFLLFVALLGLSKFSISQKVDKVSENPNENSSPTVYLGYKYIYPVNNSENFNPRDKDYSLVEDWEFNSEDEFLEDWRRLDDIRGNQLMYYRDEGENYGFRSEGSNNYLHLITLYKNPRVIYSNDPPWPYSLFYKYTTAECTTKEPFLYGYFEARMKLPRFKGAHPAFWLFSEGYSGNALEIDVLEASSGNVMDTRRHVFTTNFSEYDHEEFDNKRGNIYHCNILNSLSDEFHIYAVEWTPFDIRYYLDNQLISVHSIPEVYEIYPCYVRLGVEVDHWNPPHATEFDPLIVDYVRVYQKTHHIVGVSRPEIEYDDNVIPSDTWVKASVKDPLPTKNYYWGTDDNCQFYIDSNNDINFKLNPGGSRSTIISLTSVDSYGPIETNPWKTQVVFSNYLPAFFYAQVYKNSCSQGQGLVTVTNLVDLNKYGVDSVLYKVYLTNDYGDKVGDPIETLRIPSLQAKWDSFI